MLTKELSESQTGLVIQWVRSHHLKVRSLENEFIDHICCEVEELMEQGNSFKDAFGSICSRLGDDHLTGLEKQTILKLTKNERIMKFMTRLTGVIVLLSFFTAIVSGILRIDIWKTLMGGGMLVLGLGFAPLYFLDHYRLQEAQGQKVLHLLGFISALLISLGAFLGLSNSPYSLTVMAVGIVFLLAGFIPLSWISASKGSGKSAITGSSIFLIFFVLLSYGFLGVRISKDRVDNWVFLAESADKSAKEMEKLNFSFFEKYKSDSVFTSQASELMRRSESIVQKLTDLRDGLILEVSPSYKSGERFFKGMDNHFAGNKILIESESIDLVFKETDDYENWILTILSEENEIVKEKITSILSVKGASTNADNQARKAYLFRDFPVITDVSIINSLILNIRTAEYQAMKFLSEKI